MKNGIDIEPIINGIFDSLIESLSNILSSIGLAISSLCTVIFTVGVIWTLFTAFKEVHSGNSSVWVEKGTLILSLIALTILCGLITAALL